jgi:hypothetical protein
MNDFPDDYEPQVDELFTEDELPAGVYQADDPKFRDDLVKAGAPEQPVANPERVDNNCMIYRSARSGGTR